MVVLGSMYELRAVYISGCDRRIPCYVTLGQNVSVTLSFQAELLFRNMDQHVWMHLNQVSSQAAVTPETCQLTYNCPVGTTTDALTSFTSVMSVPRNIPSNQRGYLRWRIENEEGKQVLCYYVTVQTQTLEEQLMRQLFNSYQYDTEDEPSSHNEKSINP
ncbi:hypothetical protein HF086_014090 [Spodoptera exigua]|uniref:MD-2-related lipid-recognition domain-containing protein n=1 Tax=Spodoptera exigua TaxID=7107 RepID=A0A922SIV6_SPOEX|nr:hypothetical protein HF086_014090 [Spodoptera exigua]